MSRKVRRPQAPKPRNWVAEELRDLDGPYRPKVIKDKRKKKPKYPPARKSYNIHTFG